jgi:hypothetical protein
MLFKKNYLTLFEVILLLSIFGYDTLSYFGYFLLFYLRLFQIILNNYIPSLFLYKKTRLFKRFSLIKMFTLTKGDDHFD